MIRQLSWNAELPVSAAWIGNRYKLVLEKKAKNFAFYDLEEDWKETTDIAASHPEIVQSMKLASTMFVS